MTELNGFFMPEFFPFLFGDTWWNEIANLTGVKQPIEAHVRMMIVHGNEHRYRDFLVWANLFERTRPLRVETATKAVREIFNRYETEADWLVSTMPNRSEMCKANQQNIYETKINKKRKIKNRKK